MAAVKVTDSIYSVGILNPNMRVFDIVMSTDYGTTYNSYVLKGEKNVLIEACHKTYFEQYLANIREVIDPKNIDYIVLNHNEPDHSGALAQLLDYATNATVVVSKAGSIYLKNEPHGFEGSGCPGRRCDRYRRENAALYQRAVFALARLHVHMGRGGKDTV